MRRLQQGMCQRPGLQAPQAPRNSITAPTAGAEHAMARVSASDTPRRATALPAILPQRGPVLVQPFTKYHPSTSVPWTGTKGLAGPIEPELNPRHSGTLEADAKTSRVQSQRQQVGDDMMCENRSEKRSSYIQQRRGNMRRTILFAAFRSDAAGRSLLSSQAADFWPMSKPKNCRPTLRPAVAADLKQLLPGYQGRQSQSFLRATPAPSGSNTLLVGTFQPRATVEATPAAMPCPARAQAAGKSTTRVRIAYKLSGTGWGDLKTGVVTSSRRATIITPSTRSKTRRRPTSSRFPSSGHYPASHCPVPIPGTGLGSLVPGRTRARWPLPCP